MAMHVMLIFLLFILQQVYTQNPILDFEVTEELTNSYVGNVANSDHLRSLYNEETIAQFGFEFAPQPNQDASLFVIERRTGTIRTSTTGINREEHCPTMETCFLEIDVAIVEPIALFQVMTARISIVDINDDTPHFRESTLDLVFSESTPLNTFRILTQAIDLDSPVFGVVEYDMMPVLDEFELRSPGQEAGGSLRLYVTGGLDRERQDSYEIQVVAVDGGSPARSATMTLNVRIEDQNDNAPAFTSDLYEALLAEDQPLDVVFLTVSALDPDEGQNGEVSYALSPNSEAINGHIFGIHSSSGGIHLKSPLDYETRREYTIDVIARDAGSDSSQVQTRVTIQVIDVNDYVPRVTINALAGTNVMENSDPGTFVAYVSVFDADDGANGDTTCSLDHPAFTLQPLPTGNNQYILNTLLQFDRETVTQYALTIRCRDSGEPALSGTQNITVLVGDMNDNVPTFSQSHYIVSLTENNQPGEMITRVQATDPDNGENGTVVYSMAAGALSPYVAVNDLTGEILARQPLDYELVKELTLEVLASDMGNPALTSTAMVTIQLLDTNDEAPEFLDDVYKFQVYENEADVTRVGDVLARDKDSPQWNDFRYSLEVAPEWAVFDVDPTSGVITTTTSLNREQIDSYNFNVIARDTLDPSLVGSATVIVTVLDKNDNNPYIIFPTPENRTVVISNQIPAGQAVTQIIAHDDDILDNGRLTYSLTHHTTDNARELFEIDDISGAIITKQSLEDRDNEAYVLGIGVQDEGTPTRTARAELIIEIDSSVPYGTSSSESKSNEQNNLQAIIAVSTVSAVIVLALILIIVLIKLRDWRRMSKKEKHLMPHYKIEQREVTTYDGVCNNQAVFTVESHQDMSTHQIAPTANEGSLTTEMTPSHAALTSDHSILYDKRLDKTQNPFGCFPGLHNPEADLSSSTDVSASDSGRGGSVDGDTHATSRPGENNRQVPDILQSRSPPINRASTPHSDHHTNRTAPPSYGSFLRQKSLRENSGRCLHSPSYSLDSTPGSYSLDSQNKYPLDSNQKGHHSSHHSPTAPVIPSRSYKNSHSCSQNVSQTERNRPSSGPVFSTVHSTSAISNHCRKKNPNARQSAKHCQADSNAIKQETGMKNHSQSKRVNFSTPENDVSNGQNVAIGKYHLKDVPPNGFTSVMV